MGPSRANFHLQVHFLCQVSKVFKAAFTDSILGSAKRTLELPEDDVQTVARFAQWLYSRKFQLAGFQSEEDAHDRFQALAKLSAFSDKFEVPSLMNDTIARMWEPWELYAKGKLSDRQLFCPRVSLVAQIYERSSSDSPMRRLITAWYAWEIGLTWYDHDKTRDALSDLSQDFVVDLVMALGQRFASRERRSPFSLPKEIYYVEVDEPGASFEYSCATEKFVE